MGGHRDTVQRRRAVKGAAAAVGTAAMAVAGAVTIGVAPGMTAAPALTASLHYLRGTNIGYRPSEQEFHRFIDAVVDGTGVEPPDAPYEQVGYNAGFWPVSRGGFKDLTFDNSVRQGMQSLQAEQPAGSDLIFGYSQGAVAASLYKADHTGNTYLLVANPNRANGGIMQRFNGIKIPILDFTFNGATPNNSDPTYDIVRQYDGWSDFPTYLWNPIAVANAFMGILLVHGNTQLELTAADLDAAKNSGDPDYYQFDAGSKTHYYVIKTYPVPLLMPLDALLPDVIIAALDAPLRRFIELAYDRSDYSVPTRAKFFGPLTPREPSTMAELAPGPSQLVADASDTDDQSEDARSRPDHHGSAGEAAALDAVEGTAVADDDIDSGAAVGGELVSDEGESVEEAIEETTEEATEAEAEAAAAGDDDGSQAGDTAGDTAGTPDSTAEESAAGRGAASTAA